MRPAILTRPSVAIALLVACSGCFSMTASLQRCLHEETGIPMDAEECQVYQRVELEKEERIRKEKAYLAEAQARVDRDVAAERKAHEKDLKEAAEVRKAREEEIALRTAEVERESKALEAAQLADDKRARQREATRKSACGSSYLTPSVGMQLTQAKRCLTGLQLVGEINRADGVVTTYRSSQGTLHFMRGQLVAWLK